ncbi:sulfite exporter TauE/SafE family protein [Agrococcus beijingensis]|uniref:sulfite exporter TauE/SafE family protein n=1 Tax=Agrococcus beijingensis TaxID=3068634 RepID=UPI0027403EB1|nr:sulfite exporter TauE/SafE family protein [Agrococcus sp. REN33]
MIDPTTLLLYAAALFVATVAQRVIGLGFGLVMGPVSVLVAGPIAAVPLNLIFAIIGCGLMLPGVWRDVDWRRLAWLLLPAVPMSVVGLLVARMVPTDALRIAVGLVAIAGVLVSVAFTRTAHTLDGPGTRIATGLAIGGLNAAVGVGAPLVGAYALVSRWDPRVLAATMQPFWVILNAVTLLERQLLVPDGFPAWPWWAWLGAAAAAGLGTLLAHRIADRVPAAVARWTIIVLSLAGGAAVLLGGVLGLVASA